MRILPDRDKLHNWYLDEDIVHVMHNKDLLIIGKGFRFDGHSTKPLHWLFKQSDIDIRAALVHDFLLATKPWHRYNRKFIDKEYAVVMSEVSYGYRKKIMPFVVKWWGFLKTFGWRDYRGEYKGKVKLSVTVSMV